MSDSSQAIGRIPPPSIGAGQSITLELARLLMRFRGPLSLAVLVLLNLAAGYYLALVASQAGVAMAPLPPWYEWGIGFAVGLVLGQVYLLVLWLGLAGPKAVVRYPLAGIVLLVGSSVVSQGLGIDEFGDGSLMAAFVAVIVLAAHLPLLSARWLTGWRLGFDAANYAPERARPTQFYLAHVMWLMMLVGLPLALYRWLAGMIGVRDLPSVFVLVAIGGSVLVGGVSSTWLVLAGRRRLFPIVLVALMFFGAYLAQRMLDRMFVTGLFTNGMWILAPTAGIVACVILNLAALRIAGLKLLSVRPPQTA